MRPHSGEEKRRMKKTISEENNGQKFKIVIFKKLEGLKFGGMSNYKFIR